LSANSNLQPLSKNPKSEYRNPKQIRSTKFKSPKPRQRCPPQDRQVRRSVFCISVI